MADADLNPGAAEVTTLAADDVKDLLRVIICGSVDDGKSTLLGRMLWDSKLIFEDQRKQLEVDSRHMGRMSEGNIDFALLLDGLAAEREQGITIDVAYRFFQTDKRKFIVADTPGHQQYTRNMATGASGSEAAIILADARHGIKEQTFRHATILNLMGIRKIALAVNKMDLVDWKQDVFEDIRDHFSEFAEVLGDLEPVCIPVSAITGEMVSHRGEQIGWYDGPTLLDYLETVEPERNIHQDFRMPVQWVNRPNLDFRGFCGTVFGGQVSVGDEISVLPSAKDATVTGIVTADEDLDTARAGDAVTVTLDREIDISRGDMLVSAGDDVSIADEFQAHLIWVSEDAMLPGREYLVRIGTRTTPGRVTNIKHKLDVETHSKIATRTLELNDVGVVTVVTDQPVVLDSYKENRSTGSFILIDRYSNATVAAGMVEYAMRRATNVVWQDLSVDKDLRAALKNQRPRCLWFTGLSGAGKSTVADAVDKQLAAQSFHTYLLDGDNVRHGLNNDLGFTEVDRVENIRRMAEVAKLMVDAGLIVLVCAISPYRNDREMARRLFKEGEFIEIFVDTPIDECEKRDPKGLYKKARNNEIPNFTGVSAPTKNRKTPKYG